MNAFILKLHKLTHWEYWPMKVVYFPLFPVWLYLSYKSQSFFFFNAANPYITNGGMAMESKLDIYNQMPKETYPKTVLIKNETSAEEIDSKITALALTYPLIVKPDIGLKALGVEKVDRFEEILTYQSKLNKPFLIQELITFEEEVGLFYIRKPHEKNGRVTAIVHKEYLKIIGTGSHTVAELIKQNPRSYLQYKTLKKKYGDYLNHTLQANEPFILVPFGSHTRGAKFVDRSDEINDNMNRIIDNICLKLPDFYYGRLDIKCNSLAELSRGENFSIIEINGSGSEPTHIYDPKYSIFFAWKEIIKYWKIMQNISATNHKLLGIPYLTYEQGKKMFAENDLLEKHLKSL